MATGARASGPADMIEPAGLAARTPSEASPRCVPLAGAGHSAGSRLRRATRALLFSRWFKPLLCLCVLVLFAAQGLSVARAYRDAWGDVVQSAANLEATLSQTIERRLQVVDAALKAAANALHTRGFDAVDPELARAILFNQAAAMEHFGGMVVLNETGRVTFDSFGTAPRPADPRERDLFVAHRDAGDRLIISHPFEGRMRDGDMVLSLSRRVVAPDGHFAGVVSTDIRLEFFARLLRDVALNSCDVVSIAMTDGTLIYRRTGRAINGDVVNIAHSPSFLMMTGARGSFIERSPVDGRLLYYVYSRIPGTSLYLRVGIYYRSIMFDWLLLSAVIIGVELVLAIGAVGGLIGLRRMLLSSYEIEHKLEIACVTDALTGLANRRALEEGCKRAWQAAVPTRAPVSLILIDLDHFKHVNDQRGHAAGDLALRRVAGLIARASSGPSEVAARFGGEEFAVLLPGTHLGDAFRRAQALGAAIREAALECAAGQSFHITASLGVAMTYPFLEGDPEAVFRMADRALYHAKHSGRDRVCTIEMVPEGARADPAI